MYRNLKVKHQNKNHHHLTYSNNYIHSTSKTVKHLISLIKSAGENLLVSALIIIINKKK